jgi:hypothetical protein
MRQSNGILLCKAISLLRQGPVPVHADNGWRAVGAHVVRLSLRNGELQVLELEPSKPPGPVDSAGWPDLYSKSPIKLEFDC